MVSSCADEVFRASPRSRSCGAVPQEVCTINNKEHFMSELNRLLSFMSSWDRQAVLEQYERMFAECADEDALLEELGTPTHLAVELARSYVPTPPPVRTAQPEPVEETDEPEQIAWDLSPETAEPKTELRTTLRRGALAAYLVPAILIGFPITVALVCVGLAVAAAGAGLAAGAVMTALRMIGVLRLVSDILLTGGAALLACAVGVLLCWFGLWLSMELSYLWIGRVLFSLGKKLCIREEEVAV